MTFNSSYSEKPALAQVDRRIARENYRNYDLVARFWRGKYSGRIWKRSEKIHAIDGDSIENLIDEMREYVNGLIHDKKQARGEKGVTTSELSEALSNVQYLFNEKQIDMLKMFAKLSENVYSFDSAIMGSKYASNEKLIEAVHKVNRILTDEIGVESQQDPLNVNLESQEISLSPAFAEALGAVDLRL